METWLDQLLPPLQVHVHAPGEAARVAEEAKNHFETGRCSDSDGFSARHSSREYG